ncbi:MAG TPA: DUF4276 family protein [Pyrinomonadaceae bacterium]|nr:DUF4276 family protein [Pyrinomonadaceae bacterium]
MKSLNITLVTEGTSDVALIPHIRWLLRQNGIENPIEAIWADLRHLPRSFEIKGLSKKISLALDLYPCDFLFIHRDSDNTSVEEREAEILTAIENIEGNKPNHFVCVVPVKETEAWLLFNEEAMRRAAGNPNGNEPLNLPKLKDIENLTDPKQFLNEKLKIASGKKGRRLAKFNVAHSVILISEYIEDFSPLRNLPAFNKLETKIKEIISKINFGS